MQRRWADLYGCDYVDFMYLIEVMDTKGKGAIYSNLECETPYIVVPLHGNRP